MKTSIFGKNVVKEMRSLAKLAFEEHGNPSCICIGVVNVGHASSSRREKDGGERAAYVSASGQAGRTLLRNTLNADNVDGGGWGNAKVVAVLERMASTLGEYGSKKRGSTAIEQAQAWATHNCAESNLALYLFKSGVNMSKVTIASYEINDGSVTYKPLCKNCQQWCRLRFRVLPDFTAVTG